MRPRTSVPADDAGAKAPSFPGASSARLKSSPDAAGVTKSSPDATCVTKSRPDATWVILLSAQGRPFTQAVARELAGLDRVVLICGRYEGVDERINELYCDMELSIGDYVLSGGELAAAVVVDATMRLIPGRAGQRGVGRV